MNIDLILYILFFIPLLLISHKKDKLIEKEYFIKCLFLSILMIFLGVLFDKLQNNKYPSYSYFGSQTLFIFLIINKFLRNIYFKIYEREPEISQQPELTIDFIYTFVITFSVMLLPFIFDNFIIKKLIYLCQ